MGKLLSLGFCLQCELWFYNDRAIQVASYVRLPFILRCLILVFSAIEMIEITVNDRLGKKVRIKCNPTDTIGDLKKLIAAQTGTR